MFTSLLAAIALLGAPTPNIHWPNQTLLLISQPNLLVMGDPGPGWIPEGESEDSKIRQSFYYHGVRATHTLSMVLVEADCDVPGAWRLRAKIDLAPQDDGKIKLSNQSLSGRGTDWTKNADDPIGEAVWKNTCTGTTEVGTLGDFNPWTGLILWQKTGTDGDQVRADESSATHPSQGNFIP
jgi:hypothetical protein